MARFIVDDGMDSELTSALRKQGHDVVAFAALGLDLPDRARVKDLEVGDWIEKKLRCAMEHQRMVVTLDDSFHTWRWRVPKYPGIITFEPETNSETMVSLIENELRVRDSFEGRYVLLRTPAQARQCDLLLALQTGKMEKARQILAANPDMEVSAALPFACLRGQMDFVQWLLDRGADVNWRNVEGRTALMSLCGTMGELSSSSPKMSLAGYFVLVEQLLAHGADVNAQDVKGNTPLHYIVEFYDVPELEQRLIAAGANVALPDKDGIAPASYRSEWTQYLPAPHYDFAALLNKNGPDDLLAKLTEILDPDKQNLNGWEAGLCALWRFDWNVNCDGIEPALERLRSRELKSLHFVLGAIGAPGLQKVLEKAVAIVAPRLTRDKFEKFKMPEILTEKKQEELSKLDTEYAERGAKVLELANKFMRDNPNLFGWQYGDRANSK